MRHRIWILRMDFQVYLCIAVIMLIFCLSERGIAQEMDFGDAPDPTYPTLFASDGARHIINPEVYLGSGVDFELDGQPNGNATGDGSDEDGVTFTSSLVPGSMATVNVVASIAGTLNAWIDFNIDGDWGDAGEQIFVDLMLSPGANNLDFDLPPGAASGSTFARFRFSLQPDLSFVGQADSGEVEDYQVEIDAPEPAIDIQKYTNDQDADTPTGPIVEVGSSVTWLYEVTNVGNVPLSSVTVTDSQGVTVSCPGASLDPGESMICEASGTAALGQYANVGTATAISPQDQDVMDEDPSHYLGELPPTDFGDAQDPTYPTLLESDGARHLIDPDIHLGSLVDPEQNGQPDGGAQGDDNVDDDDEDGVVFTSILMQSKAVGVDVTASTAGLLNAWIDFNNDGDWDDPDEQIFTDTPLSPGLNNLTFDVPVNAEPVATFARFRFDTEGGLSYHGEANDGEVEDYTVEIEELIEYDFGDAQDPTYPTLLTNNGARHIIVPEVYLGSSVDPEDNGQPDGNALGDDNDGNDDEDGLIAHWLVQGNTTFILIKASVAGILNAWVDFNIDGDWSDPDEHIFVNQSLTAGDNYLNITTPSSATYGISTARFRFSTVGDLSYDGPAPDGEVEDHLMSIWEADYGDAPSPYPTILSEDGARHVRKWGMRLGGDIDSELDGQPNSDATGDDNDGNDDEDGVTFTSMLIPGETATVQVTAVNSSTLTLYLNAWIDLNRDGDWADAGEQIITDAVISNPGVTKTYSFSVPSNADPGTSYARFRLGSNTGTSYTGLTLWGEVEDYKVEIRALDYGDAPDPTYPTLLASNGARHVSGSVFYLGAGVDSESDGQPHPAAMGDDGDGNDDEDGVTFTSALTPGSTADVTITIQSVLPTDAMLNAWVDFNIDGDWADPGERIFVNHVISSSSNLNFSVPSDASIGSTFARFRLSEGLLTSYDGLVLIGEGEVEDYQVEIRELLDYGDAPDTYRTLLASNGARHAHDPDVFLGLKLDLETDGQPDIGAAGDDLNGDDDEDGVSIASPLRQGQPYQITVTASTDGLLNAWLDFNDDGFWTIPDEQIFTDEPLGPGPNPLTFNVPIDAVVGDTFARFRFSRQAGLLFGDRAEDGEVEDYVVEILEAELDYGDAADDPNDPGDYPTLLASDGARHVIVPGIHLGSSVDPEPDGQPTPDEDGDDNDGNDDEDGVSWEWLWRGHTNTVDVTASTTGLLNGWIDLNIDGDWADPGEHIFVDIPLNAGGINHLSFDVPDGPDLGPTVGRFRFSTEGGLSFTGQAKDGEVEDSGFILMAYDFGDAPDPPYPTLLSSNGASHPNNSVVYLGSTVDYEVDGQPHPNAMGDDNGGTDDEDGVTFTSAIFPGGTSTVTVISSQAQRPLDAWIDFTIDGDWDDTGEHIFDDVYLNAGPNNLSFNVPEGASPGLTFARFRLVWGDMPVTSYDGPGEYGEVEDYQVEILEPLDYGDAPDTYRTLLASNGARHAYDADVYLGLKLDLEPDGHPDTGAQGDDNDGQDDEDGVNFTTPLWRGETCKVTVTASIEGLLNAWMDFNDDGVWNVPEEQIFTDEPLTKGPNYLTFKIPREAVTSDIFSRFRFSRQGGLSYEGRAEDGEVEDYVDEIMDLGDMDFGDAPDPTYPTLWANNGARHVIAPGVRLGQKIDADDDGQPDPNAAGDDTDGVSDEEGSGCAFWRRGHTETLTVYPSTGGYINAWTDFNADGDWTDPGEYIIQDKPVSAGTQSLPFNVPANAVIGITFARVRFSTYAGLSYEGLAWDGEVEDHDIFVSEADYGDAPAPYPTKILDNGASHEVRPPEYSSLVCLGSGVDGEVDGQPELSALGDDNDGNDDEDGVAFISPLVPGDTADIQVTVSAYSSAYLYGWIDFNRDGDWADPDDYMIYGKCLFTGTHVLSFTVPIGASPGPTFARFRIAENDYSVASYVGFANSGEVEDYQVEIAALPDLDYGDAPDPTYPTLEASNGARHIIDPNIFLGLGVDPDPDGQPHAGSQGDDNDGNDDEDGVTFLSPLVQGTAAGVKIIASVPGVLNAWIDFNGDGDWADADDHVFIDQPLGGGSNVLPVNVPPDATPGATFARFRFCTRGELSYEGEAINGEVEDYHVEIEELTSAITGKVWSDKNSSGGIDSGEPGIPGVTLDLLDTSGNVLDTGVTDSNGDYYFYNLSAGDYVVDVTDTGNVLASYVLTTANDPAPVTLALGQTVEVNFGYYQQTATMDFGDAPDPSYPTLLGRDGARHIVNTEVYLGPGIDAELDGKPDTGAQGDDNADTDDEDGVTGMPSQLIPGDKPNVTVSASIDGYLNAWIDFNQNGDWSDPGEQIFTNEFIAPGPNNLTFKVPTTAVSGATFARFRYNLKGGLSFHGLADDGEVEDYLVEIGELRLDFGDAPDSYSTKLGRNGARHPIVTGIYMGSDIDEEMDGQDSADAQGDDSTGSDDEDGVVFTGRILPGAMSGMQVTVSTKGNLYGYMDFNGDGDFDEPDEYISVGAVLYKGVNKCYFNVPSSAVTGPTFARLRFSTGVVASYDGQAEDGEVEDYVVEIEDPGNMDFGDAPDSYSTKMISDGARHVYVPGVHLGNSVDYEADGQPNAAATGDDLAGGTNDEDGVILTSSLMPGNKAYVAVTASKLGFLNAWIDFNIDGDWADSGERIFYFEMVYPGLNSMNFNVPAGAVLGETYARFRFSTSLFSISYDKLAHDGEVEDYKVEIGASTQKCGDTNGDGVVNILDAIVILSYLFLGGPPPSCPPAPYCCAEVNGDGVVDISDATALLSYLWAGGPPPVNSCCQGPPSPVTVPTVQIVAGIFNVIGQAGGSVTLPISLGDTTGLEIGAAVMHLTYDPDVLTPVDVNTEGTIASGWDVAYDTGGLGTSSVFYDAGTIQEAGDGHIVIALAGSQELSGSGSLVNVVFSVANDAVEGQTSPIRLSDISFSSGNPAEVNGEAEFAVGEPSSISLQSGWNLISLPLQPPNTNPGVVLSSIAGKYRSVWAYDPYTGWSTYIPGGPGGLVEIRAGKGYWIEMDASGDLDIQGTTPEPMAIRLWGEKWNLVGYNSNDQKSAEQAMSSVRDYIDSVCEYSPITGWSIYSPGMPGDLEVMKRGYGYWIKANETCDWDVNAP